MSFSPGSGFKKPLNTLTAPVYPNLKKQYPRFVNSGKHWEVDVGQTMLDTEDNTQLYEDAVLAVGYDRNRFLYGISSHKDVVNNAFRPPMRTPDETQYALQNTPRAPVVPRLNPGSTNSSGSQYLTQNIWPSDLTKHITDRVKSVGARPTFLAPEGTLYPGLGQNAPMPDLSLILPSVSASSGVEYQYREPLLGQLDQDQGYSYVTDKLNVSVGSGAEYQYRTPFEEMSTQVEGFEYVLPQVSVDAGKDSPLYFDAPNSIENIQLRQKIVPKPFDVKNVEIPVDRTDYSCGAAGCKVYLGSARPSASAHSGKNSGFRTQNSVMPHYREKKIGSLGAYNTRGFQPQSGIAVASPQMAAIKGGSRPALSIQT